MKRAPIFLTNGVVTFSLIDAHEAPDITPFLRIFLSPYFWECPPAATDFDVRFRPFEELRSEWLHQATQPVVIRYSNVPSFHLTGKRLSLADGSSVVVDERTQTGYHLLPDQRSAVFYATYRSRIHLIEFVRYTALLVEEAKGSMLLHATASVDDNAAYVIIGEKAAGKTTTMLRLVLQHHHTYLAGDKVLVSREDGKVVIRGWPDFPHIGIGTLRTFPRFAEACRVKFHDPGGEPKAPDRKEVIEPGLFREAVRFANGASRFPPGLLIFPNVSHASSALNVVGDADKSTARIAQYIEHPHAYGLVQWHDFLRQTRRTEPADNTALLRDLLAVPWLEIHGTDGVDQAVLRSVVGGATLAGAAV